jgi:hypothetical protein
LGRDASKTLVFVRELLLALPAGYPVVADADALFECSDRSKNPKTKFDPNWHVESAPLDIATKNPLFGRYGTVLTPNSMEFRRLWECVFPQSPESADDKKDKNNESGGGDQKKEPKKQLPAGMFASPPMSVDWKHMTLDADTVKLRERFVSPTAASSLATTFAEPDTSDRGGVLPWDHPWAIHTSLLARQYVQFAPFVCCQCDIDLFFVVSVLL